MFDNQELLRRAAKAYVLFPAASEWSASERLGPNCEASAFFAEIHPLVATLGREVGASISSVGTEASDRRSGDIDGSELGIGGLCRHCVPVTALKARMALPRSRVFWPFPGSTAQQSARQSGAASATR